MKILFLDIDGVVNCASYFKTSKSPRHAKTYAQEVPPFDPYRVLLVHRICEQTGAKVVVSSSWRLGEESLAQVKDMLGDLYLDKTPRHDRFEHRYAEIQEWVDTHDVERYAILDDDMCASDGHGDNFFKTEWESISKEEGLTGEIAAKVVDHLNQHGR